MAILEDSGTIEENAIEFLGIRRITADELGIKRSKNGTRFAYIDDSKRVLSRTTLKRIAELVIPPAWSEVRIATEKDAHLQAVGRDAAGRLQYIYHPEWVEVRDAAKAFRLSQIGGVLGRLRVCIRRDLTDGTGNMPLAAAARLVDLLHLRAGHEAYAGDEGGRGVSTLLKRHLKMDSDGFHLAFRGKGGKHIEKSCDDPLLITALKELRACPGARLFKLKTNEGWRPMTAADLNQYLAQSSGKPITAKDFRTLFASSVALNELQDMGNPGTIAIARRAVAAVARQISIELANTPAVTRKSYIHPRIVESFKKGKLGNVKDAPKTRGLSSAEAHLIEFLQTS
ncbi:MAG TPA: DNA topoisomerase IB [Aestuariivirga sp.]|nr:DNA topoisomerase IB [Aestuariivirga sp.]